MRRFGSSVNGLVVVGMKGFVHVPGRDSCWFVVLGRDQLLTAAGAPKVSQRLRMYCYPP